MCASVHECPLSLPLRMQACVCTYEYASTFVLWCACVRVRFHYARQSLSFPAFPQHTHNTYDTPLLLLPLPLHCTRIANCVASAVDPRAGRVPHSLAISPHALPGHALGRRAEFTARGGQGDENRHLRITKPLPNTENGGRT